MAEVDAGIPDRVPQVGETRFDLVRAAAMHDHHVDIAARRHLTTTCPTDHEQTNVRPFTEDLVVQTDQPLVDGRRPGLAPGPTIERRVGQQTLPFDEYHSGIVPCAVAFGREPPRHLVNLQRPYNS